MNGQDNLDPSLKGADAAVLSEYEEELRLYEAELQKERELACAELFVKAKAAKAQEQAELVGYLKEPGAFRVRSRFVPHRVFRLALQWGVTFLLWVAVTGEN